MGRIVFLVWFVAFWIAFALAQQPGSANNAAVPHLVHFGGVLKDAAGQSLTRTVGVTFALYRDEEGGSPLWLETQNVTADKTGHYTVSLGATKADGMPLDLFASGEARWLGVQVEGQPEQTRIFLLSVPYALKAADAETIGGLPASAFVLATPSLPGTAGAVSAPAALTSPAMASISGGGTQNYVPLWTDNNGTLGNSVLFQSGSGTSARIGINLKNPLTTLDVNGSGLMRGFLEMATIGYATPAKGFNSNQFNIESSAYNSTSKKYSLQHFVWQAEPVGNNTTNPSASLNLLFGTDPAAPTETGLKISSAGIFTFAPGQAFPGTGTITGVTAGTDLTGGGTSGNVTLSLNTTVTDARYAQLGAANIFSQEQQVQTSSAVGLSVNSGDPAGIGVQGFGNGIGVEGMSRATNGIGVSGYGYGTKGVGVFGTSNAQNGVGVSGTSTGTNAIGVEGTTSGGTAIYGQDLAAGMGVEGVSTSGSGVYGFSSSLNGVYGYTTHGTGVQGISGGDTINTAGVFGRAGNGTLFGGIAGVWGDADQHVGVFGSSNGFPGVAGTSQNSVGVQGVGVTGVTGSGTSGVIGTANSVIGYGVAGINNNFQGGVGVYGHSSNGLGFYSDSNVGQSRSTSGWVKAMVFVDPFAPGGTAITRCYNSNSGSSIPPCGISILHELQGQDLIDFGYQINDRFISATAFGGTGMSTCVLDSNNQCYADFFFPPSASQLVTNTFSGLDNVDVAFWVIVF
jgi:hypothetical protein